MVPNQPIGDGNNLTWMIENRLRQEEQSLEQLRQGYGQNLLNTIFDGMVSRMTVDLVGCVTEQDRLMVQALVISTMKLKQALSGHLDAEEARRLQAEKEAKERNTSWQ